MHSHEVFIHIHQGCFAGTGAIVRLPQCQWSKPDENGKIGQCITTTKHSKAKTVCIFLNIYCILFIPIWLKFVPRGSIDHDSGNGLALNRRQAIIWTDACLTHWRIYAALGGDELHLSNVSYPIVPTVYGQDILIMATWGRYTLVISTIYCIHQSPAAFHGIIWSGRWWQYDSRWWTQSEIYVCFYVFDSILMAVESL